MRADHVPVRGDRTLHVDVTVRGDLAPGLARRAAERVAGLQDFTTGPILHARVVLTQERNARIALPARAEAQLLLAGDPVRASVAAPSMRAAIDQLADRLRDRLRRHIDRVTTHHHLPAEAAPGEWRHGAWPRGHAPTPS